MVKLDAPECALLAPTGCTADVPDFGQVPNIRGFAHTPFSSLITGDDFGQNLLSWAVSHFCHKTPPKSAGSKRMPTFLLCTLDARFGASLAILGHLGPIWGHFTVRGRWAVVQRGAQKGLNRA